MNADIVVIGSGVAGTAVVTKLLEANPKASIVMLEAGGKVRMRDFGMFQNFMVTGKLPQDSRTIYDSTYDQSYPDRDTPGENTANGDTRIPLNGARMFAYGGSTGHWGGWSFRMKREDFELASRLRAQGITNPHVIDWPISYDTLEEFHSRQVKARMPDSIGDFRVRLSRSTCLGSGSNAANSARSQALTSRTARRS